MGNKLPTRQFSRRAAALIVMGVILMIASAVGLMAIPDEPHPTPMAIAHTSVPTLALPESSATPLQQAVIPRGMVLPTIPVPTASPTSELVQTPLPTIVWSDADKNALSWLCWYEVRGMAEVRNDACLSVISTIRARYAYDSGFGTSDVVSTILAEGQFTGVKIDTSRPAPDPDLYWLVELYANGARGSCTGYFYFDSVPGGPSLCVIQSSNGQFVEFHNGWK
jgi:hypothetical protein